MPQKDLENWIPKTELGRKVKAGEIKDIDEILKKNYKIMEAEIVDFLIPNLEEKVMETRKTAYVLSSGRKQNFRVTVIVGDRNGHIGVGVGKDKERWPAIRKALKEAKQNLILVQRGCGSWECGCGLEHSIPAKVEGKCGSVKVVLKPAPRGAGLVAADSVKPIFELAGIKDVYVQSFGKTKTTSNFVKAVVDALEKTTRIKMQIRVRE